MGADGQAETTEKTGRGTPRVFLNYRREDTQDAAGRLYDALAARFGDDRVFMDIDTIDPGLDFEEVIVQALDSCDVVVALIGRHWLTVTDAKGRRRLNNPEDFVRRELEAALEHGARVIPVLVQGVEMPGSDELPGALKKLAHRHAVEISPTRWNYDVGRLATALERIADSMARQQARRKRDGEEAAGSEQAHRARASETEPNGAQPRASGPRRSRPRPQVAASLDREPVIPTAEQAIAPPDLGEAVTLPTADDVVTLPTLNERDTPPRSSAREEETPSSIARSPAPAFEERAITAAHRPVRPGRRRWGLAGLGIVAIAVAIVVVLAQGGSERRSNARRLVTARSGPLSLAYSAPWLPAPNPVAAVAPGATGRLHVVGSAPISLKSGSTALLAGTLTTSGTTPAGPPPALVKRYGPVASSGAHQVAGSPGRLYVWEAPRGQVVVAYVLGTTGSDIALICAGPRSASAALTSCGRLATSAQVSRVELLPAGPDVQLLSTLRAQLGPVAQTRVRLGGLHDNPLTRRAKPANAVAVADSHASAALSSLAVPIRYRSRTNALCRSATARGEFVPRGGGSGEEEWPRCLHAQ